MTVRPIISAMWRNKTGAVLVAMQVAISFAILANALHIVYVRQAMAARPSGVLDESAVVYVELRRLGESSHEQQMAQQKKETTALKAIAGVISVAMTNLMPMTSSGSDTSVVADRRQLHFSAPTSYYMSPDSLISTLGLKLIEGRDFLPSEIIEADYNADEDAGTRPRAVIVTKALAAKVWPSDQSYAGKTLYFGSGADAQGVTVVGVVERLQRPSAQLRAEGEFSTIVPMRVSNNYSEMYALRVQTAQRDQLMRDVETALIQASASPVIVRVKSVTDARAARYRADMALSWMLVAVSVLLLMITASGIFGISSLWVTQRHKQIGVRRALGARRIDIMHYFLIENFMITSAGVASGALLAIGANLALVANFEIDKLPLIYLPTAAAVFWIIGAAAVYRPAWKAASISPAVATRSA